MNNEQWTMELDDGAGALDDRPWTMDNGQKIKNQRKIKRQKN